jgi:hypothetical protein
MSQSENIAPKSPNIIPIFTSDGTRPWWKSDSPIARIGFQNTSDDTRPWWKSDSPIAKIGFQNDVLS